MRIIDLNNPAVQSGLAQLFSLMKSILSEKHFRLLLGAFAIWFGKGSMTFLSSVSQASRQRISRGKREIETDDPIIHSCRTRRPAGGRKTKEHDAPGLENKIIDLLQRSSYGSPDDPKCRIYSTMTLLKMQTALISAGIRACRQIILRLVRRLGFTKQINKKPLQIGKPHPDTDKQMHLVTDIKQEYAQAGGNPVISIDAKAKVALAPQMQKGREWRKAGDPRKVEDHDFVPAGQKATPFGIYDILSNLGFVNVGTSSDTAIFAVESLRRWWYAMGKQLYPKANRIIILCDGGGSNGWRLRLWKYQLAILAGEIGLPIEVHHYPPGKSRFNAVEHRLFNHISMNWAGQPMTDVQTVLRFIQSTTTASGLKVTAVLDENQYETGLKIPDDEMNRINLVRSQFLGSWNYTIHGFRDIASTAHAA